MADGFQTTSSALAALDTVYASVRGLYFSKFLSEDVDLCQLRLVSLCYKLSKWAEQWKDKDTGIPAEAHHILQRIKKAFEDARDKAASAQGCASQNGAPVFDASDCATIKESTKDIIDDLQSRIKAGPHTANVLQHVKWMLVQHEDLERLINAVTIHVDLLYTQYKADDHAFQLFQEIMEKQDAPNAKILMQAFQANQEAPRSGPDVQEYEELCGSGNMFGRTVEKGSAPGPPQHIRAKTCRETGSTFGPVNKAGSA